MHADRVRVARAARRVGGAVERVEAPDDGRRTGPPRCRVMQRELHPVHCLVRRRRDGGELRHRPQDRGEIDRRVVAGDALGGVVLHDAVVGHLGDDDHRRARKVGLHDAERAGAGDERALPRQHCGPAGEATVHVRHARRDLFTRCEHRVDALCIADRFEDLDRVATGNAVDMGYAALDQCAHDRNRCGCGLTARRHGRLVYHRAEPGAGTLRPTAMRGGTWICVSVRPRLRFAMSWSSGCIRCCPLCPHDRLSTTTGRVGSSTPNGAVCSTTRATPASIGPKNSAGAARRPPSI